MYETQPARLRLLALSLCAALLAACAAPAGTPAPGPLAGATLNIQLSEKSTSVSWTLGAASVDLRQYQYDGTNASTGDIIATGSADASGKGTLTLPGEAQGVSTKATLPASEAALWFVHFFGSKCTNTLSASNPAAKLLLAFRGEFSTSEGGDALTASHSDGSTGAFDVFTYATADTTVSGNIVCSATTYPVSIALHAGWNIVEAQTNLVNTLAFTTPPLSTTVQLTRVLP